MTRSNPPMRNEFEEIAHAGGKITFNVIQDAQGRRAYDVSIVHQAPRRIVVKAVYALPQGLAVRDISLGGIGQPWNRPPIPGCVPVFISSDSEGHFGHACPDCTGYWRSDKASVCPYCGIRTEDYQFLSEAQQKYVRQYCETLRAAVTDDDPKPVVIDMDAVADAVGKDGEKPPFYSSDQRQQHQSTCTACGEFYDILGRFGYCPFCGTRNDLSELEIAVQGIRGRLNSGAATPQACLQDAVAAFDALVGRYADQLIRFVPITAARRNRLSGHFHDLADVISTFNAVFDLKLDAGIDAGALAFVTRLFFRRHVYEHRDGIVDQKYLDDSGDTTVRLGQQIRETREDVHRFLGFVVRFAKNLHEGFHSLLPPLQGPIDQFRARQRRLIRDGV